MTFDDRVLRHRRDFDKIEWRGGPVLCLGAGDGAEVAALRDFSLLAIGIDMEYPKDSTLVHHGDMSKIPYPVKSFDTVYCRLDDPDLDLDLVFAEIKRVLITYGQFVFRLTDDKDHRRQMILDRLRLAGFSMLERHETLEGAAHYDCVSTRNGG